MDFGDMYMKGFLAGFIGDSVKMVLNLLNFNVFHLTRIRYLDFASALVYGHFARNFGEAAFAQVVELVFSGIVAAVFVFLLTFLSPRNLYYKSMGFAIGVWFSALSIAKLFRLPGFNEVALSSAVSTFVTSGIDGLIIADILRRLGIEKDLESR